MHVFFSTRKKIQHKNITLYFLFQKERYSVNIGVFIFRPRTCNALLATERTERVDFKSIYKILCRKLYVENFCCVFSIYYLTRVHSCVVNSSPSPDGFLPEAKKCDRKLTRIVNWTEKKRGGSGWFYGIWFASGLFALSLYIDGERMGENIYRRRWYCGVYNRNIQYKKLFSGNLSCTRAPKRPIMMHWSGGIYAFAVERPRWNGSSIAAVLKKQSKRIPDHVPKRREL